MRTEGNASSGYVDETKLQSAVIYWLMERYLPRLLAVLTGERMG